MSVVSVLLICQKSVPLMTLRSFLVLTLQASRKLGFPVLYGDGSRPSVLFSAGISSPKAVMVMYTGKKRTIEAVQRLRVAFPGVILFLSLSLKADLKDCLHLLIEDMVHQY